MDITGSQTIPAPRQAVWDALHDPAVLKQCLPGCESVERAPDGTLRVVVAAAVGPLRARFNGTLRLTEAREPESCVIVFEGQGGAVGFGRGKSGVQLSETAQGTQLAYTAQAEVGGKLAQVGSRLIDSVAHKMADDFFESFRHQLMPASPQESAPPDAPSCAPAVVDTPLPQPPVHRPSSAPVMVPGWWLAAAAALGAMATLAGSWLR
ncbi:MAG TPA: carbon monoxide dehydrogenase subunit G [Burkholderiaceae bacterium]|nr:carbon monoxide dehydrogenase subunit G [Burkholderiaceae bacterium]